MVIKIEYIYIYNILIYMTSKKKQAKQLKQHLKKLHRLKVVENKKECLKELLIKQQPAPVGWWWLLGY
jgi:hypothetical protein